MHTFFSLMLVTLDGAKELQAYVLKHSRFFFVGLSECDFWNPASPTFSDTEVEGLLLRVCICRDIHLPSGEPYASLPPNNNFISYQLLMVHCWS